MIVNTWLMKFRLLPSTFVTAMTLLPLCGCGKDAGQGLPADLSKTPAEVQSAFAGAPPGLKQAADEAAQGISAGEYAGSMERIGELSTVPDLTSEQRRALGDAQTALVQKLSAAEAAGDAQAAAAMSRHRARK